ncbi:NitT/TauT family transport system substrate-binding protein [Actinoplanes campanulatus]|uniref:NitT/TauT family transport system substrate-binding protein n=1 Tax=Actinoplanes campanulatus TaxID=113559 RepID=A0A7W5AE69_9ACTN|nr:aliphatic sulfonate ABC transporter substrate-binding protein [Actinoplanes campanulatus]MBB3094563.1 NitT/TauT family transport system substrate-binding protein [Actinoplanes campanulatus]GGN21946.1 putative nitrate ABC transporter, periplasmic protein [Actinoplanes campanulatus]GID35520.1 putative nitrate ABC transporter, periplasmic protein [Actinoplanes campanulatus]
MRARLAFPLTALLALTGCTVAGQAADAGAEQVVVGYQSKTINTVTAGTLLRAQGFLEKRLGDGYQVVWQDYDTGAPITAQMMAGKIDIGSMGDYPLLINGARGQQSEQTRTKMIAVTGFNQRGALNTVVVANDSKVRSLSELKGKVVSTSVGSAAHGLFVQALRKEGLKDTDVKVENQQPPIGASALQSGNVDALSQFVAWPGLLVHRGEATVLYDGGALGVPTLHGTVVREAYADEKPDVVKAFLAAQQDATEFLWKNPVQAAEIVAKETGLPAEVVYLYNGANGIATFDLPIKPDLRAALDQDVPFLRSIGVLQDIDLDAFVDDSLVQAGGTPGAVLSGTDAICGKPVGDKALAGELWLDGESGTQATADPTCLLKAVKAATTAGKKIRAAYVPDAGTGTRWFADKSTWVRDGDRFLPFVTEAAALAYNTAHPGSRVLAYEKAVNEA